jgi:hypothetical protein
MERCIRCKRTEEEVELLDGIYIDGSASAVYYFYFVF